MSAMWKISYVMFIVTAIGLEAQTLFISPSSVSRGGTGSLIIRLSSPDTRRPVALQWELSFTPDVMVSTADLVAGSAAETAEKSMTCAEKQPRQQGKPRIFACIIAGGQMRLPDGTIAIAQYRVPTTASAGPRAVVVDHAIAIAADLRRIDLPRTESTITEH